MSKNDSHFMRRALEVAARGRGFVEPNPMVGCVIVDDGSIVAEGWHQRFGGPHAEVNALTACPKSLSDPTLYVTLEPCCHQGKTPPCTEAVLASNIKRVVVACLDPSEKVAGQGVQQLRGGNIDVSVGVCGAEAQQLIAPFRKLCQQNRPWVIAKWAMTLDGKIATREGDSQWISSPASRKIVHDIRGRVDAVMVGSRTAAIDDPLLTPRPAGPRNPTRIVFDSLATLSINSKLVQSLNVAPVIVVASSLASQEKIQDLREAGCEVLQLSGQMHADRLHQLLDELGRRSFTNLLVEGGASLMGLLVDQRAIDEVHVFMAPKIIGGEFAKTAVAGTGSARIADGLELSNSQCEVIDGDIYVRGFVDQSCD